MAGEEVETFGEVEFDVVEVADTMGWELPLVKRGLRQLQWNTGQDVYSAQMYNVCVCKCSLEHN